MYDVVQITGSLLILAEGARATDGDTTLTWAPIEKPSSRF